MAARRSRLSDSAHGNQKVKASHVSGHAVKVEIREKVMAEVGAPAHVFDAFCGDGGMYRAVWHKAASCVGCDMKWYRDGRLAYAADNRRILRAIDLQQFNVFDFDAHGSPWEQVWILGHRRLVDPGERIGLVLTEGTGLKLKMGGMPIGLSLMAGVPKGVAGAARHQAELHSRAILRAAKIMECRIVRRWQAASNSATKVYYIGVVLEGLPAPAPITQEPEPAKPVRKTRRKGRSDPPSP